MTTTPKTTTRAPRLLLWLALALCVCLPARGDEEQLRAGLEACARGQYRESATLLESALQAFRRIEGETGVNALKAMTCLARSYNNLGRYREALPLARNVAAARTATLGEGHPDTLAATSNVVEALRGLGQTREAMTEAQKGHEAAARQLGERHGATISAANTLAVALVEAGRPSEAVALLEPTVASAAQVLGERHTVTLSAQGNLANAYGQTGRLGLQLDTYEKVLRARRELQGDGHPDTWTAADNLAVAYLETGRLDEATGLLKRNLAQRKERLGDAHPLTLTSMTNLAGALGRAGRLGDALALAEEAVKASVRVHGAEHPLTLSMLPGLADHHGRAGNLAVKRALLDTALRAQTRVMGANHPLTLDTMQRQLDTLTLAGRDEERLLLAEQLLERRRAVHGANSLQAFQATRAVALSEFALGRRDAARRRLQALAATEAEALAAAPVLRVATLRALAALHAGLEQPDDYLTWAERASAIARSAHGALHAETLRAEQVRADALYVLRRHDESVALRRQVLEQQEKLLGPYHLDVVTSLRGLLAELLLLGRYDEAKDLAPRLIAAGERLRQQPALSVADRQEISAQLANAYRTMAALHGRSGELPSAYLLIETCKARTLLDALAHRRAGGADVLPAADRQRLAEQEAQVAALERRLAGRQPAETVALLEPARNAAVARLGELQRDLKKRHPRYAQLSESSPLPAAQVTGALDPGSVFVHYFKLGHGHGYFALLIDPSGPWVFTSLGEQPDLDDAIEMLRQAHADPGGLRTLAQRGQRAWRDGSGRYRLLASDVPAPPGAVPVTDADALAADLGKRLLGPLEAHLAARKTWIVSPDGALARLPFELLQLGGRRVLDRATVQIAQSLSVYAQARTLQKAARERQPEARLLAFGDPAYAGGTDAAARRSRATFRRDTSLAELSPLWEPLPGTRREVEALARLFPDRAEVFLGEGASKQQLQALQAQGRLKGFRYVHMATHGYASDTAPALSAVVLSQRNLPPGGDGYVTASEWPAFELGSELTVLSACDTALGTTVPGEGVLGLPYALFIAGSAGTVLTLWPVDDAATALLMEDFYRRLVAGTAPAQALTEAKRALAANPRHAAPRFWAPFVLVGAG